MSAHPPLVITVCTGNICRSPAAELLLARLLGPAVEVASAGTHAVVGGTIPGPMLGLLHADGIDGAGHRGRALTPEMMAGAAAIITMTTEHRRYAVQLAPAALRRTFTLAELAACAGTGAELPGTTVTQRIGNLPAAVAAHRHALAGYELDDVPDPYRRSDHAYQEAYSLLRGGMVEFARWVGGN